MEPTQTANEMYDYNTEYNDIKLSDLVQECHKYNCNLNGWYYQKLKIACYGFDNLAVCLGIVLDNIDEDADEEKIAELIHEGWVVNYVYWRDNKPWLNKEYNYQKPSKPLGDDRRNLCATTKYKDLPDDEKEKDLILARWVKNKFF